MRGRAGSRSAKAVALLLTGLAGCYYETGSVQPVGVAVDLVGSTCRVGLDLSRESGAAAALSRDGLLAVSELRGEIAAVGEGLVQLETGKATLWIPLERVRYIEREK